MTSLRQALMGGAATCAVVIAATPAFAEVQSFDIPAQPARTAIQEFGRQSGLQILASQADVGDQRVDALKGDYEPREALRRLLVATNLRVASDDGRTVTLAPQSGSAAGDGADQGTVQALIVTAQKREENIQDVPIAMSAFTQEDLTRSQVAGGPDLITQVPNMTFTKTNFSSYSIQLRGIGTQAISATVDPAVAVAFNNTPFIRNRFFEQEFYDLQRVEVLRGPQGTLYGRNATAGVVNLISAKPKLDTYEAKLSADVGNYNSSRLEGMLNIPLVEDKVALRLAGAWTKRDGYDVNQVTGNRIDGRDLWSTRVSLRMEPSERVDANLVWEHFEEDDDRIRSGKQLCKTDVVTEVAGIPLTDFYQRVGFFNPQFAQSIFSQGCVAASLYSPDSFQKTNALALPYYVPLSAIQLPVATDNNTATGNPADPYASRTQSTDLRSIEAAVDPGYRAKTDLAEVQVKIDLSDALSLNSETAWGSDFIFSTQDYNRFAGAEHAWRVNPDDPISSIYLQRGILTESGEFCDPQIGCSDRLVAMDLSTARSRQFSQEFRLASNFDGPFNFSLGANFLRYDTEDKYYVFINSITMLSAYLINGLSAPPVVPYVPNVTDNRDCLTNGMVLPDYNQVQPIARCTYIDPNPISNLNDLGHNYFLSRNPYKLISYAAFGEAYYQVAENLKVTAGLRWTVDKKQAPEIPSWIFAANTAGYPVVDVVNQEWREPTGRLAVDWKPDLAFTDETLLYASLSHGYKAGGMNPPSYGKTIYAPEIQARAGLNDALTRASALHPKTFDPEFVNAFELGAKNTLLDAALVLNLAGFYYDYKGYQLSQIVDRSAVTHNYDAEVWGLEIESDWRPMENLRFGAKLGFEKTRVADGMKAIDVMDRTAGDTRWMVVRPFPSLPTNCVLPTWLALGNSDLVNGNPEIASIGNVGGGGPSACEQAYLLGNDPGSQAPYVFNPAPGIRENVNYAAFSTDLADFPCWPVDPSTGQPVPIGTLNYPGMDPQCLLAASNNGEGFYKNLSGKEFPNAPHMTATLTADYTLPLPSDWLMTLHTDLYYQSESWARIFNTPGYDKLKAYNNVNLAAIFTNEDAGWKVMAYVKNVFDRTNITGAFLNSDDTGLTTNIFLNEPRLFGLRVTKDWNGGPWWTGANPNHAGPFPFTIELTGQLQRQDAPADRLMTPWVDALPANIAPANIQSRDFDWGDGRSLKLVYKPDGSAWSLAGSIRYGRTNNDRARVSAASHDVVNTCGVSGYFAALTCGEDAPYYFAPFNNLETISWSDAEARSAEEHTVADFTIGRDIGVGSLANSSISIGLRYADLESQTDWATNAQSDWTVPEAWLFGISSYHRRHIDLNVDRTFRGWGPLLGWDAALPVWGNREKGMAVLDWSLNAGALVGTRKARIVGEVSDTTHTGTVSVVADETTTKMILQAALPAGDPVVTPINIARSKDATVPVLDLALGASYLAGRVKVGAGYRWERYFDVLDVGQSQAKEGDRTIDGPYFKIAVGFGG